MIAPNYDPASQSEDQNRMGFSYVYILQSQTNGERFYTGLTDDLQERLNCGSNNIGNIPIGLTFLGMRTKKCWSCEKKW
jgi:hypothetical protein